MRVTTAGTRPRPRRRTAARAAAFVVLAAVTWAATPAAAVVPPVPRPPGALGTALEDPASYVGQVSCEPGAKPGTLALRSALLATYGTATFHTLRPCSQGGTSEHKDGRALDWMLDASDPADKAVADRFLSWLTGPDADGVPAGNARRLGVMYVVWNRQIWASYRQVWRAYTGSSPHTDHIHISLSWDGAMGRTSWWTGRPVLRPDYGPCREWADELAAPYSAPRYSPCPEPKVRRSYAFPRLWDADQHADLLAVLPSGELRLYPGDGAGRFDGRRAVGRGWASMRTVSSAGDMDEDGSPDLVAASASGRLSLYRGDGRGGFVERRQVGRGWGGMDAVTGVGDLDGDRNLDLLARRAADGALIAYHGNGRGGFRGSQVVGDAAGHDLVTAVGDWDGDDRPDVVARQRTSKRLVLYAGTASGGLSAPRSIGTGWGLVDGLVGVGDFDGDGRGDLLSRRSSDGTLWLYAGRGDGGFRSTARIGTGWGTINLVR